MTIIEKILNSPVITYPWNHQIIDNTFNKNDIEKINSAAKLLFQKYSEDNLLKVNESNSIYLAQSKSIIGNEVYNIIYNLNEILLDNIKLLLSLYPQSRKFNRYVSTPVFQILLPNSSYMIHDESVHKSMSIVTYLYPTNGIGTLLYTGENKESFVKEVEWKPNRSMIFCGELQKTWHSFHTNEYPRITLNFFIRQNNFITLNDNGEYFEYEDVNGKTMQLLKTSPIAKDVELIFQGNLTRIMEF